MAKILIVEDEENIIDLLVAIFDGEKDFHIFCARDGKEALSIARINNPDIVILDVQLPKFNGYEVCRLIKEDPAMSNVKVLMLSGMTQNSDLIKAREVGADDYLTKPFTSTTIIEKVERLLEDS